MSQKKTFIKTTDKDTADKLISLGFQLVAQNGGVFTFLNQLPKNVTFDEADKKKMAYTNVLSV